MPTAGFAYACGMKDKQWGIDGKVIVKVTIKPQERRETQAQNYNC